MRHSECGEVCGAAGLGDSWIQEGCPHPCLPAIIHPSCTIVATLIGQLYLSHFCLCENILCHASLECQPVQPCYQPAMLYQPYSHTPMQGVGVIQTCCGDGTSIPSIHPLLFYMRHMAFLSHSCIHASPTLPFTHLTFLKATTPKGIVPLTSTFQCNHN